MIWQGKKKVYSCRESYIQDTRQYKFRTIGSEVSPCIKKKDVKKNDRFELGIS